jgi:hypothetical protein
VAAGLQQAYLTNHRVRPSNRRIAPNRPKFMMEVEEEKKEG